MSRSVQISIAVALIALLFSAFDQSIAQPRWRFKDVTKSSGLSASDPEPGDLITLRGVAGGAASADYDRDGWPDVFIVRKDIPRASLFKNLGNGSFAETFVLDPFEGSGPLFFDYDGDGWLDLFVGAQSGVTHPKLFRNLSDGSFADVTDAVGLGFLGDTISASAVDFDGDGFLDLYLSHWGAPRGDCHLWRNIDGASFACADADVGLTLPTQNEYDVTFTGNFVDLNGDGAVDLLSTSDYGTSSVWLNRGDGTLYEATNEIITDENGMGAAVGDYDGDGDFDWFVTSIYDIDIMRDGHWGRTGNRMYKNKGDGTFEDATDEAGVRRGGWGWGASFADFNNDGNLDLAHVNGWTAIEEFRADAAHIYAGDGRGHFEEMSATLGFDQTGDDRAIVCFDYDRDGDVDILVGGAGGLRLWSNEGGRASGHFLAIALTGSAPNTFGVGATIAVTAAGKTQLFLMRAGSNYVSQNGYEAYFGLGASRVAERIVVTWPDGHQTEVRDVAADQHLALDARTIADVHEGCGF